MATPTNATLVQASAQFLEMSNKPPKGPMEIWQITTKMMVPAGTNVEQLMADMVTGKTPGVANQAVQGPITVTDVVKVAG